MNCHLARNFLVVLLLPLTLPTLATADALTGLTAYWRLDETSGSTAYDSIGSFDAALSGTSFINDPQRGPVLSPGTGGGVVFGAAPISGDATTIIGWVKENSTDGYNFFLNDVDISVPSEPRVYMYSVNGQYRVGLGTNSSWITSANFDAGAWHQVALSWQAASPGASTGNFTAYFDGLPVQGTVYAGLTSIGTDMSLGNQYYPPANAYGSPLNGVMSEFGVWNRALSDTEVYDIFQAGHILPTPEPATVGMLVIGTTMLMATGLRRQRNLLRARGRSRKRSGA